MLVHAHCAILRPFNLPLSAMGRRHQRLGHTTADLDGEVPRMCVRECVCVRLWTRIERTIQVPESFASFTFFFSSFAASLCLCASVAVGTARSLVGWIAVPLYTPKPCVVWLNCHCTKHKREKIQQKGTRIYTKRETERERNEWPCHVRADSEIFLRSSCHHASCVCLMEREWQGGPPPNLSL